MATIKDLRPITPRTNGTRKLYQIKNITRHHSAGSSGSWTTFWPYWRDTKKWGTGGYHEIILRDGTVELCYDPEEITNGVGGPNSYIYNICLVGNGSFTEAQEKTCVCYWMGRFGLTAKDVKGDNEFPGQATSCPGIDMNILRSRLSMEGEVIVSNEKVEYERDAKPSPSLASEFARAVELGITDGTYPNRPATRAETAVMIVRASDKQK